MKMNSKLKKRLQFTLLLFGAGAVLGTTGDICHLISHTTGYPQDAYAFYFWIVPFWVPLLFGSATVLIAWSHPFVDRLLNAPQKRRGMKTPGLLATGIAGSVGLYCLSGFLPFDQPGLNDGILAGGFLALWYALDREWQGLVQAFITALGGVLFEIFLVSQDVFYYRMGVDHLFGVASWLPWLYMAASVGCGNFGRFLDLKAKGKKVW